MCVYVYGRAGGGGRGTRGVNKVFDGRWGFKGEMRVFLLFSSFLLLLLLSLPLAA